MTYDRDGNKLNGVEQAASSTCRESSSGWMGRKEEKCSRGRETRDTKHKCEFTRGNSLTCVGQRLLEGTPDEH